MEMSHVHCLLLPSSPSQFSILSTSLPQDKCIILLAGNDLTDLDQVFCKDVQHLPVNFLSWQDREQNSVVLHWLLFTGFLICFSSVPHYPSRFLLLICCNFTSLTSFHFPTDYCSSLSLKNYSASLVLPQDTFPYEKLLRYLVTAFLGKIWVCVCFQYRISHTDYLVYINSVKQ